MSEWEPTKPVPSRGGAWMLVTLFTALAVLTLIGGVVLVVCVIVVYRDGDSVGLLRDEDPFALSAVIWASAMSSAATLYAISVALRLAIEAADNLHQLTDVAISFDRDRRRASGE